MPMVCAWGFRATHQACIQHLALWRKATFSKETAHHFKWYAIPKVCRTQIRLILYLNWKSIGLNGTEYYWFCTDRPALYCFLFTIRPPNIEKLLNVHQGTVKLCLDLIEHAKKNANGEILQGWNLIARGIESSDCILGLTLIQSPICSCREQNLGVDPISDVRLNPGSYPDIDP